MSVRTAVVLTRDVMGGGDAGVGQSALLGCSFLKRAVLTLHQGGIERVVVVHGSEGAESAALLQRDETVRSRNMTIGYLLLGRGRPLLDDSRFDGEGMLLLEETTVFDPQVVAEAREAGGNGAETVLLASFHKDDGYGDDIGIRVDGAGRHLVKIARGLKPRDAVYTGICICRPVPLDRLAQIASRRSEEPSARWEEDLFQPGEARVLGIREGFSVPVHSAEALAKAESGLLRGVRKETDGFVSRNLNRPVSLRLSKAFIAAGLTPNMVSYAGLAVGLAGAWFTFLGGYGNMLAGAALFQLSSILDGSDGEVAKLTFNASERGSWIDTLCDELACLAYFVSLPLGLYRMHDDLTYLLLGFATLAGGAALYPLMIRHVRRRGSGGSMVQILDDFREGSRRPGLFGSVNRIVSALSFVVRRDFFSFAIFLLCLLGRAEAIGWIIGTLTPVAVLYFAWFSSRFEVRGAGAEEKE